MVYVESTGSTAGYMPLAANPLDGTVVAYKCSNVVAGHPQETDSKFWTPLW